MNHLEGKLMPDIARPHHLAIFFELPEEKIMELLKNGEIPGKEVAGQWVSDRKEIMAMVRSGGKMDPMDSLALELGAPLSRPRSDCGLTAVVAAILSAKFIRLTGEDDESWKDDPTYPEDDWMADMVRMARKIVALSAEEPDGTT